LFCNSTTKLKFYSKFRVVTHSARPYPICEFWRETPAAVWSASILLNLHLKMLPKLHNPSYLAATSCRSPLKIFKKIFKTFFFKIFFKLSKIFFKIFFKLSKIFFKMFKKFFFNFFSSKCSKKFSSLFLSKKVTF